MDLHNALAFFSSETKVKDKQESIDLELIQIMTLLEMEHL